MKVIRLTKFAHFICTLDKRGLFESFLITLLKVHKFLQFKNFKKFPGNYQFEKTMSVILASAAKTGLRLQKM